MADPLAALMAAPPGRTIVTLTDIIDRPAWQADALCHEYPHVEFFPGKGQPTAPAKDVCRRCLVRDECLAYALELDLDGVWGATSTGERQQLRRAAA